VEAHEYYKKETGKLYYREASLELELTDDYINWLERNVVKLFAIHAVVGQTKQPCPFCGSNERTELNTHCKWLCSNCDNAYGHN
jgi:transposase-like protein